MTDSRGEGLPFGLHGQSLRDSECCRSKLLLCESLGNPLATEFSARDFAVYCEARLRAIFLIGAQ